MPFVPQPTTVRPAGRQAAARLVPARVRGLRHDVRVLLASRRFGDAAAEAARAFDPQLVYERSEYFSIAGLRAAATLGIPLVLEVNGILPKDARTMYRSLAEPLGVALERRKHRSAAAIVTVSPGLGRRLVALGARPETVVVVPNTVAPDRVARMPRPVTAESAVIGWIGHIMSWHADALEFLIEVAPAVLSAVPHARFVIIGTGPRLGALEEKVMASGLSPAVRFTGEVAFDDVPRALHEIDVGVIPDVFDYAFPVKLVEFGAAGIPVVAPRSDSLDEQVRAGVEYAPFVRGDPDSLVETLVGLALDGERRAVLGSGLLAAVRDRFTWTASGDALATIVGQALAGGDHSRTDNPR